MWNEKEKKEDEETKLTKPSEEEKKKEERKRKEKKESESKVATSGSLGLCLITEIPLKTELLKLKTSKMCFQFL